MAKNVINFKLIGFKELEAQLVTLGRKKAKKVVRLAVQAAGRPIAKAAKSKIPVRYGLLKKSVASKVKTYKDGVYVVIGPKLGSKQMIDGRPVDPANYAHLVEYGTAPHLISPAGSKGAVGTLRIGQTWVSGAVEHPGSPAQPFMRPAFDSQKENALNILKTKLAEGIEREAAKP